MAWASNKAQYTIQGNNCMQKGNFWHGPQKSSVHPPRIQHTCKHASICIRTARTSRRTHTDMRTYTHMHALTSNVWEPPFPDGSESHPNAQTAVFRGTPKRPNRGLPLHGPFRTTNRQGRRATCQAHHPFLGGGYVTLIRPHRKLGQRERTLDLLAKGEGYVSKI